MFVWFFFLLGGNKIYEFFFVSDVYRILLYIVFIFIILLELLLYLNLLGIVLLKIIL